MVKRTVPELAEFLAEATGLPDSNLRSISRRLREAGLLSQHGHGRGAAAATAEDAATILLVAAIELPPLHAAVIGQTLRAGTPWLLGEGDPDVAEELRRMAKVFHVNGHLPESPIELTAGLIEGHETIEWIEISVAEYPRVQFMKYLEDLPEVEEPVHVITYTCDNATQLIEFQKRLGGRFGLRRSHHIDGQVLLDIADWLMPVEAPA